MKYSKLKMSLSLLATFVSFHAGASDIPNDTLLTDLPLDSQVVVATTPGPDSDRTVGTDCSFARGTGNSRPQQARVFLQPGETRVYEIREILSAEFYSDHPRGGHSRGLFLYFGRESEFRWIQCDEGVQNVGNLRAALGWTIRVVPPGTFGRR